MTCVVCYQTGEWGQAVVCPVCNYMTTAWDCAIDVKTKEGSLKMIDHVMTHHITQDNGDRQCTATGEVRTHPEVGMVYSTNGGDTWVITNTWHNKEGDLQWSLLKQ
jgi:hypothetical protein